MLHTFTIRDEKPRLWQAPGESYEHVLMKHSAARCVALFKIGINVSQLIKQFRDAIPPKYRPAGRLSVFNFVSDIKSLTASKQIAKVSRD